MRYYKVLILLLLTLFFSSPALNAEGVIYKKYVTNQEYMVDSYTGMIHVLVNGYWLQVLELYADEWGMYILYEEVPVFPSTWFCSDCGMENSIEYPSCWLCGCMQCCCGPQYG